MSSFSENFFKTSQRLMSYSFKRNTLPEILQKKRQSVIFFSETPIYKGFKTHDPFFKSVIKCHAFRSNKK